MNVPTTIPFPATVSISKNGALTNPISPPSNNYGQLLIQQVNTGGHTYIKNTTGNKINVFCDGKSYDFDASQVNSITYVGARGGGNILTNQTGLTTTVMTYTGNNTITPSGGFNLLYLSGDNNTYKSLGKQSMIYTYGKNNHISGDNIYLIAY
jgi:hypothetical protein